jgi:hypothetical protein
LARRRQNQDAPQAKKAAASTASVTDTLKNKFNMGQKTSPILLRLGQNQS